MTPCKARELFDYDPETGILTWRARGNRAWDTRYAGKRVGSVWTNRKSGYRNRHLGYAGKRYLEHRVIWMWMTGEIPPVNLDHDNRDATDNRWHNIVGSSPADNSLNRSMDRRNTSGAPGVTLHRGTGKWQVQCCVNGASKYLGLYADYDEAVAVSREWREKAGFNLTAGTAKAPYVEAMS